ncbi:hypothetical protein [uncultured Cellulomonas sp.]|uniref:hypothetical protein n=1 Tax=uncultured Cellulomonas sp. TaxID=189682 RepID=UPI00262E21C8|nr:hypothetical protein [uncultured Cellulomonas sp.]
MTELVPRNRPSLAQARVLARTCQPGRAIARRSTALDEGLITTLNALVAAIEAAVAVPESLGGMPRTATLEAYEDGHNEALRKVHAAIAAHIRTPLED